MTDTAPGPVPRSGVRRILTWQRLFVALLLVWVAPRLLPHVGAAFGVPVRDRVAPRYTVTTLDGATLSAETLRGRVVLVNFWATWCVPCRVEMPLLELRHTVVGPLAAASLEPAVRRLLAPP